jgi:hypothetical protein
MSLFGDEPWAGAFMQKVLAAGLPGNTQAWKFSMLSSG